MTMEYFFYTTKHKDLKIPTNINFEYAIPKKMKVINTVVKCFKYDILYYEEIFRREFRQIRAKQYRKLVSCFGEPTR